MKYLRSLVLILVVFLNIPSYSQDVYKTPSGTKYHLATCRMVENVSQKLTVEKALSLNLEPCKICKPAVSNLNFISNIEQKPKGQGATTQCKGMTKKGTRCLHRTSIANGFCFQHNPDK